MAYLILWLALPLILTPLVISRERIDGSAGQLLLAGFGLAALQQGAGTLDLLDLRLIGAQSPHDASFIGITAGVILSGGCLLPDAANWRKAILGLPLAAAIAWIAYPLFLPVAIGAAIGSLPSVLARVLPARAVPSGEIDARGNRRYDRWGAATLLLPVIPVVTYLGTAGGAAAGVAHWQPLLSTGLVALALVAAARRGWEGAAPVLMLLVATRDGTTALVAAIGMGLVPLASRYLGRMRAWRIVAGVLCALVVSVLMRDQVLLAVILTFGLATLANRVVAPVPAAVHL
ncbi:MAG: hypothetical protein ABUL71_02310 [Gemmatimonadota bacterium]